MPFSFVLFFNMAFSSGQLDIERGIFRFNVSLATKKQVILNFDGPYQKLTVGFLESWIVESAISCLLLN